MLCTYGVYWVIIFGLRKDYTKDTRLGVYHLVV